MSPDHEKVIATVRRLLRTIRVVIDRDLTHIGVPLEVRQEALDQAVKAGLLQRVEPNNYRPYPGWMAPKKGKT